MQNMFLVFFFFLIFETKKAVNVDVTQGRSSENENAEVKTQQL